MANDEIKFLEKRMRDDAEKVDKLKQKEQYDEFASSLRMAYECLTDKGFSDEQAFWVLAQAIMHTFKTNRNG